MVRNHHAAGASILVAALATAALSGNSCAINERGQSGGSGSGPMPPTCTDTIQSGDEIDVDCGGSCSPCKDGKKCLVALDCESGVCTDDACATPTCTDGVRNGAEADADCGSSCTTPCADGKACKAGSDCSSTFCISGACVPHCSSLAKDEDETDLDCGGSCATKCSVDRDCNVDADCVSGDCSGGLCNIDPGNIQCFDGMKSGDETSQDCGGGACTPCKLNESCLLDSDCLKILKCDPTLKSCQLP